MTDGDTALRAALRAMPKTELHLHALGAMRPETIVALARRAGSDLLPGAERAAAEGFAFPDLTGFIRFFLGLFALVLDAETAERVAYEALEDAARGGVRWAELRWTPTSHVARGAEERALFEGIAAGLRAAQEDHGIHARVVVDFPRGLSLDVARAALGMAVRHRRLGVTGFDVAGDESVQAADPAFAPLFAEARRAGLHLTAHAGEGAGAESVAGAMDLYGVRRIGHGTRAVEDADLLVRLAREGVVLEVCASSNVALRVVPAIGAHPVGRFRAAGVRCAVSTDDPTLFGTDIVEEHVRLHRDAGLSLAELAAMAREGLEAAFVEPGDTGDAARAAIDRALRDLAAWRPDRPPAVR